MKLIPHSFNTYEFDEGEEQEAHKLSVLQQAHIQNLLAAASRDKLDVHYDPENPLKFAQQEAYISGQIHILRYILDLNEIASKKGS